MEEVLIRPGRREDVPQVMALILELATYEKAPHEVTNSEKQLAEDGFGPHPSYGLLVAEMDGTVVGMALWYQRYSTWKGKILYLEDIVVTESLRGSGIGKKLFDETVREAKRMGYHGMRWQILEWNEPALNFYRKYGASFDGEWVNGGLTEDQIRNFE